MVNSEHEASMDIMPDPSHGKGADLAGKVSWGFSDN